MHATPTQPSVFGLPITNQSENGHRHSHTQEKDDCVTGQNTHCAHIYSDFDEQMAATVPFLQKGLERGEHCVYTAYEYTIDEISDALREGGIDVETAIADGALSLYTADEVHLRSGSFDRDTMLDCWQDLLETARENFIGLRAAGEMTWALDENTPRDALASYEALLNPLNESGEYTMLCQYDRTRFPDAIISDVIRTHPLVVSRGTIDENFHYTNPEQFLSNTTPD